MLKIDFDCHVHTTRSACGEDITDDWLCRQARDGNICFAVTDHAMHLYYEREIAWSLYKDNCLELFEARRGSGRDTIIRYAEDLRACGSDSLLVGIELDVLPNGEMMFAEDLRPELDLFLGAIHHLPAGARKEPQEAVIKEFRQQVRWLMDYDIDVLAHPFRYLLSAKYEVNENLVAWTVDTAAEYGVALEINSHKPFPDHDVLMTRLCAAQGVQVAVGTDAHHTREFGNFDYHRDVLRQAGIEEEEAVDLIYTAGECLPL